MGSWSRLAAAGFWRRAFPVVSEREESEAVQLAPPRTRWPYGNVEMWAEGPRIAGVTYLRALPLPRGPRGRGREPREEGDTPVL